MHITKLQPSLEVLERSLVLLTSYLTPLPPLMSRLNQYQPTLLTRNWLPAKGGAHQFSYVGYGEMFFNKHVSFHSFPSYLWPGCRFDNLYYHEVGVNF